VREADADDAPHEDRFSGPQAPGPGQGPGQLRPGQILLIVSTDRISAFDHILPNGIPDKGKVLNQISIFWFQKTAGMVRNHLKEIRVERFPEPLLRHVEVLRDAPSW